MAAGLQSSCSQPAQNEQCDVTQQLAVFLQCVQKVAWAPLCGFCPAPVLCWQPTTLEQRQAVTGMH